jgi:hypothetical protein
MAETSSNTETSTTETFGYLERLRSIHKTMNDSRLVNQQERDTESMRYFEKLCNESLPQNEAEQEIKQAIRSLYYTDKSTFNRFLHRLPWYVLLTDARNIVYTFGIHELVYIAYDDDDSTYHISPRDRNHQGGKRNARTGGRRNDMQYLHDKIHTLEEQLQQKQVVVPLQPFVEGQKVSRPRKQRASPANDHEKRSQNPYEALSKPENKLDPVLATPQELMADKSDWANEPESGNDEKKD